MMDRSSRFAITLCYAAMAVMAISLNLMPVCLPILSMGIGGSGPLSKEELGRIAAVAFAGVVIGILINGPLANRYHAKWFTSGACLLISIGLGVLGLAHSYAEVLVAVAILGFGSGTLDMILSPVVCALRPDQRTTAMNWLHSFYCVGATLTILVATFALAWGIGWHALAFALLAIPAVIGILFLIIPLPRLTAEDQQRLRVRDMIFDRYFLLLLAAIFFGGATEMGMAQWLPSFAELDLKMSAGVGGMALLAFSLAMALARMVVGSVSHGIPMRHVMIGACASTAVLLVACGICPVADVALAAAILSGFTGSCLWPSTLGLAGDRYPLAGASMFGILAAAGSLGGVIMPWGVGLVADHGTIALGLAVSALCPVLMLVCLVLLGKGSPTVAPAALPLPPMA